MVTFVNAAIETLKRMERSENVACMNNVVRATEAKKKKDPRYISPLLLSLCSDNKTTQK